MRTDRLLHYGCGLLGLSLLIALGMSGGWVVTADGAVLALVSWLHLASLVMGAGMVVGHLVAREVRREPTLEEQVSDWFE